MAQSPAERAKTFRARKKAGVVWEPKPHGTNAAITRHYRNHEPLCELCRLERNRLQRDYQAARRRRTQP